MYFSHALNTSITKEESLAALWPFQCFLLVCVVGRGPRGQAVVTAWSLSMVLTDHPNNSLNSQPLLYVKCFLQTVRGLNQLFVKVKLILELLHGLFLPSELYSLSTLTGEICSPYESNGKTLTAVGLSIMVRGAAIDSYHCRFICINILSIIDDI